MKQLLDISKNFAKYNKLKLILVKLKFLMINKNNLNNYKI